MRNFCKSQSAEEYVSRVKDARPLIRWHAECYHYEIRSQTRIQVTWTRIGTIKLLSNMFETDTFMTGFNV